MGYIFAHKKQYYNLPDYYNFSLDETNENYEQLKDAGIDGDYVVVGEFNDHPVYSNRN